MYPGGYKQRESVMCASRPDIPQEPKSVCGRSGHVTKRIDAISVAVALQH